MKRLIAIVLVMILTVSLCPALAEYTDSETIQAVQQALADRGYYKGNISGIKGNATEAAIKSYQQKNGLKATGQIDDELLDALSLGIKESSDYTYILQKDKTAEITGYRGTDELIVVPDTIDGHIVTSIGEKAFSGCADIKSVELSNGIKTIKNNAFERCGIKSISLPDSLTDIGDYAFTECYGLVSITLPNNVSFIGKNPFFECRLSEIIVSPDHPALAVVDNVLFYKPEGCLVTYPIGREWIEKYEVPQGTRIIGSYAFSDAQIGSIILPDTLVSIQGSAFWMSYLITEINVPEGITEIPANAFLGCSSLTNITLPNSLTSIGKNAFALCESLCTISIPKSVKSIKEFAFEGDTRLTLTIPHNDYITNYCKKNNLKYMYQDAQ